ncbi:MAG: HEPN domain-containing protein [Nitrospirae bacterium]|nr:HEPN domain-containing protein [Nitrospirota bacterium]
MGNRYKDWMRQAEADLGHARHSLKDGDFEWSCFAAHQAAEKALKALFCILGGEAWGHTLKDLVEHLPTKVKTPSTVVKAAKHLDRHYIPARYPNGYESGAPVDYYEKEDAQGAIQEAEIVLEFCRRQVG